MTDAEIERQAAEITGLSLAELRERLPALSAPVLACAFYTWPGVELRGDVQRVFLAEVDRRLARGET